MRIVAENLTFSYNKKTKLSVKALNNVSLTIEEGDFFGIIGHTGSGKSTFIQHLNGLIPVESGTLKIGDYDLSAGVKKDKKQLKVLRSKVGMVFQYPEYQLFELTVFDDVAFGYKNFFPQADEKEIANAVYEALNLVGLKQEDAKKSPFELSGGQKRRVAIAGVIVTRPEILVLDEPVAGLDPLGKRELMKLLHSLKDSGKVKTVVIVSHDMDEVAENCNRIAVFKKAEIVEVGTPREIFKKTDELVSLRLEAPVTGIVTSELKKVGVEIETDFTIDGFVSAITDAYKSKN